MAPDVEFKVGDSVMIKGGGHQWIDAYNEYIGDIYSVLKVEEADSGYKVLTLCDGSGELILPGFYSDEVELITSDDLDELVFDTDLLGLEDLS